MLRAGGFAHRRGAIDAPVELRFVDLLLIIIATLMFVAVLLSLINIGGSGPTVAPRITTTSAPAAIKDRSYQLTLAASGGDGTLTWRLRGGRLPDGLSLRGDGVVAGTPAAQERTRATIEVSDGQRRSHRRDLVFEVRPSGLAEEPKPIPLRLLAQRIVLPDAVVGNAYRYQFTADTGSSLSGWAIRDGRLPAGLALAPDNGQLTGNPRDARTSDFTITAKDATGTSVTQAVRLSVVDAPPANWVRVLIILRLVVRWVGYLLVLIAIRNILFGTRAVSGTIGLIEWLRNRGK